jgi:glycosyltransferase involved in cell wall biosynthesis
MRTAVIIPVFNGAATVAAATQSAFAQERAGAVEVIVVNDGSTDRTGEVLKSFGGRIKTVSQANRGLAAARNVGADAADAADYLAFLDADDLWLPDKLRLIVAELARNHGAVLAYSNVLTMDRQGQGLSDSLIKRPQAHAPSLAELLRGWWPILPSSVVVRRDAFERCGRFCEEFRGAAGHEDVDCWLRLRELGEFVYLDRALVRYRVDPDAAEMLKYENNFTLFAQRVRDRYGARGRPLLRAMRRGYVSAFGYRGLVALRAGDRRGARQAFFRALGYAPLDPQTLLRLGRTFLPASLARSLSGNSRVQRLPRSRT